MTPADLSKFKPGDKVHGTFSATLGDYAPSGSHVPFVIDGDGTRETHIVLSSIVSIERVRPALPGLWEWRGSFAVWIAEGGDVVRGQIEPDSMMLSGDIGWHPGEIAKVIEAVRNA